MKKLISFFVLAMMMVAAVVSLSACSSDDDEGSSSGRQTLTIDDKPYYYGTMCYAEQTRNSGMYLHVTAVEDREFELQGIDMSLHIALSKVSDLHVGDTFAKGNMSVQTFRNLAELTSGTYMWDIVEGEVSVTKITSMELTLHFNSLKLEHKNSHVQHTISGTAILTSGAFDSNNKQLSFAEAAM